MQDPTPAPPPPQPPQQPQQPPQQQPQPPPQPPPQQPQQPTPPPQQPPQQQQRSIHQQQSLLQPQQSQARQTSTLSGQHESQLPPGYGPVNGHPYGQSYPPFPPPGTTPLTSTNGPPAISLPPPHNQLGATSHPASTNNMQTPPMLNMSSPYSQAQGHMHPPQPHMPPQDPNANPFATQMLPPNYYGRMGPMQMQHMYPPMASTTGYPSPYTQPAPPATPGMPPHPQAGMYGRPPLSPVFKDPYGGPPEGTTPGTPGVQQQAYAPTMPGMPPNPPPMAGYPSVGPAMPPQPQIRPYHHSIIPRPYPAYAPGGPRQRIVHQEVKLEISATGLRDRDRMSKSDPTCVVFMEERSHGAHGGPWAQYYPSSAGSEFEQNNSSTQGAIDSQIKWREVGRTECIKNNLNPHFKMQITIPYHFEQLQHIRLGLWDIDSKSLDLKTHDFLGDVRTTVAELVMGGEWQSALSSPNPHDMRTITGQKRDLGKVKVIVHENRDGGNMLIKVAMSGRRLDRKDFLITSDPYVIATQLGKNNAGSRSQLYKSEVIRRNVNPTWRPFQIKVAIPKGGGKSDIRLEFLVYDKDTHRRDDEIGKAVHTVAELEKAQSVPVINDRKKKRRKSYKNSGILEMSKFQVIAMPSLVDYLQGGLKLHFTVAVDFTASNGNPAEPLSLHFCHSYPSYFGNRYTRALTAVANVLRVYCPSDNMFAAFGFGAELPGNPGYTSSCFPLGLGHDPMCYGIEGILQAYMTTLSEVKLSGPTNFAPLIETVSRRASQRLNSQTDQNYDVLLILTDGVVSDFNLTVDRIIAASHTAPLSIIIIGIGERNFMRMKQLDSDDVLLQSGDGTRQAARDICQFVDFQEYEDAPPERLGAAVLAELPGNIVEYFVGVCDPPITPGGSRQPMSTLSGI